LKTNVTRRTKVVIGPTDSRAQKNEPDGDDPESHTTITIKDGFKLVLPKNYSMPPSKKRDEKDENGNDFVSFQKSALPNSAELRKIVSHATNKKNASYKEPEVLIHWVSTLGIVVVCYVFAVLVPGFAIVWDIAGSSMTFLIQFIVPSACYIRLKQASEPDILTWHLAEEAWILVVMSSIGSEDDFEESSIDFFLSQTTTTYLLFPNVALSLTRR
jgi:hypothetical protein